MKGAEFSTGRKAGATRTCARPLPSTPGVAQNVRQMNLAAFVVRYEARPPAKPSDNADQDRQLTVDDGVVNLVGADASAALMQPACKPGTAEGKALWVIVGDGVPAIVERAPRVRVPLQSGVAKHSNLTGAGLASCGGECWVDIAVENRLWVTGASGRYGPRTPQQLLDAVAVLAALGYDVISAGWSTDNDWPERTFREA